MRTLTVDLVAGARPNFMKVAPILRAIAERRGPLSARLVHTGQHYAADMSDVFFEQLAIRAPDAHLEVGSGSHGEQTARVLERFERHLREASPASDGVVVVGDVNSTLACALAAVKLGVRVAHVEAGLRSFDRSMPEEINRIVTDAVSDLLLVSEPQGEPNLAREGVPGGRVRYVGNVMIDSLVRELGSAEALGIASQLGLERGRFAYVTLHRPANVDEHARLEACVALLEWLAGRMDVVFPVHPRTRERLERSGLAQRLQRDPRIRVLGPLGYRENLALMAAACVVLTDSGGIQEETTYLGVPCLTLRPNTERPVTVELGTNTVLGDDLDSARAFVGDIMEGRYKKGRSIPGWDGRAAERIVEALSSWA